ncbi:hypothetical protein HYW55_00635 [Candidatus Gottesmanbacteria bacterium]|nr:hypothetical protein [Candidatus Gottesmanbacteria bacterium]
MFALIAMGIVAGSFGTGYAVRAIDKRFQKEPTATFLVVFGPAVEGQKTFTSYTGQQTIIAMTSEFVSRGFFLVASNDYQENVPVVIGYRAIEFVEETPLNLELTECPPEWARYNKALNEVGGIQCFRGELPEGTDMIFAVTDFVPIVLLKLDNNTGQ